MSRGKQVSILFLIIIISITSGCWRRSPSPPDDDPSPNGNGDPVVIEPELPGALLAIVENHPLSRPQSGLERADIVYEMVSEGNITRFLAVFYWNGPEKIGPIRSVRPAFTEVAAAYKSPLAHAGGSTAGLASVRSLKMQNLDEIHNASRSFWRANDRRMPHNLYTSAELLISGAQSRDYRLTPLPTDPRGINIGGALADLIEITYSRSSRSPYATQFVYRENRYYKHINTDPFIADNGLPIVADNVIVLIIRTTHETVDGNTYANIHLIGNGKALFFNQGKAYEGTWSKTAANRHFSYAVDGEPFLFTEGKTWVQIVPSQSALSYSYTHPDGQSVPEQ